MRSRAQFSITSSVVALLMAGIALGVLRDGELVLVAIIAALFTTQRIVDDLRDATRG